MAACGNVSARPANNFAVFQHIVAFGDVPQGDFVAQGNGAEGFDLGGAVGFHEPAAKHLPRFHAFHHHHPGIIPVVMDQKIRDTGGTGRTARGLFDGFIHDFIAFLTNGNGKILVSYIRIW